ncbi:MAG: hypothetical protein K6347_03425 [Campylobacterales bacterium]
MTLGGCNATLWNGINSKTRAGVPCFGCMAYDFPRHGLFETKKYMGLPDEMPLGVSKRAYFTMAGVAKSFRHERLGSCK